MGAWVAERPMRWIPGLWAWSLSRFRESMTPLLEEEISWISSTMTQRTPRKAILNLGAERARERDSGVVMKMCGGLLSIFALSLWGVSPVLTATLTSGMSGSRVLISSRGWRRFLLMSLARALRGET